MGMGLATTLKFLEKEVRETLHPVLPVAWEHYNDVPKYEEWNTGVNHKVVFLLNYALESTRGKMEEGSSQIAGNWYSGELTMILGDSNCS